MGYPVVVAVPAVLSFLYLWATKSAAAATSLANVGPGLGTMIGPENSFSDISDYAKWILIFSMLLGRLEIFTVMVLFTSYFWRQWNKKKSW